ncbi:hypothetical protein ANCDUO_12325 [Ancylostoma duodenale]|uniref:Uncharacterized protein n=1 Tax=Ancylostoma duodenale TaxID=51022 RepID=A0A0C2GF13_9BILA|nr:hypothetical protein ANCDUO_12325 [Ancylostoma duodenale]
MEGLLAPTRYIRRSTGVKASSATPCRSRRACRHRSRHGDDAARCSLASMYCWLSDDDDASDTMRWRRPESSEPRKPATINRERMLR